MSKHGFGSTAGARFSAVRWQVAEAGRGLPPRLPFQSGRASGPASAARPDMSFITSEIDVCSDVSDVRPGILAPEFSRSLFSRPSVSSRSFPEKMRDFATAPRAKAIATASYLMPMVTAALAFALLSAGAAGAACKRSFWMRERGGDEAVV